MNILDRLQLRHPPVVEADPQRARARRHLANVVAYAGQDFILQAALFLAILYGGAMGLVFVIFAIFVPNVSTTPRTAATMIVGAVAIVPLWLLRSRVRRERERAEDAIIALIPASPPDEREETVIEPYPEEQRVYVDLSEGGGWPAGDNLHYECLRCGDIVPSLPARYRECSCGNVFIDPDAGRFSVGDEQLLRAFMLDTVE